MAKDNKKGAPSWDSDENEAQNNFLKWGDVGDFIFGTLVSKKQVPSTLEDRKGEMQWVYEFKVKEGQYHEMDKNKAPIGDPIVLEPGDIISVGGRAMYDSRMSRVKIGQMVGLKFTELLPAKSKSRSDTKMIKTYTPKGDDGEFQMDVEFLQQREAEEFDGGDTE